MKPRKNVNGFTLIELLIVIVLAGILAAIAVPMYSQHQRKSYRSSAKAVLLEEAQRAERYFTQNVPGNYEGAALETNAVGGAYRVQFANANGDETNADIDSYTLQAVPLGGQVNDVCGTLSVDNLGRKLPANSACW